MSKLPLRAPGASYVSSTRLSSTGAGLAPDLGRHSFNRELAIHAAAHPVRLPRTACRQRRLTAVDVAVLRRARVFVDSTAASGANGEVCRAIHDGTYSAEDIAGEIGEILDGSKIGRRSNADITIAKFIGLGAQDLVAAEVALTRLNLVTQVAARDATVADTI
jgi:hypothetical protein